MKRSGGVSPLPGRKRVALYKRFKNGFRAVAYFNEEKDAEAFVVWLRRLAVLPRSEHPDTEASQPSEDLSHDPVR